MTETDCKWVLDSLKKELDVGRIENVTSVNGNRDQLVIPVGHGMAISLHVEGTALKCAYGLKPGIDLHSPDSMSLIIESIRKCIKWHVKYDGYTPVQDVKCPPCPLSSQR